jgi:AcrR family transcriptional regulator
MPPKKGQRQARWLARQDQILDVAFDLFANLGVRATTIAAVAEQVGLSEAGVLHHFPSKEELLLAVLHRADASFTDEEAWMAQPNGGADSLRRIFASAEVLAERPLLCRLRIVVNNEALVSDGPARRYVKERLDNIRRGFRLMLREGVRRGDFRSDIDVDRYANEIIAFTEGIQVQWLLDPDNIDIVQAHRDFANHLIGQLCPAPA